MVVVFFFIIAQTRFGRQTHKQITGPLSAVATKQASLKVVDVCLGPRAQTDLSIPFGGRGKRKWVGRQNDGQKHEKSAMCINHHIL